MNSRKILLIVIVSIILINITNTAYGATSVTLSSPAQTETTVTLSWTGSDDWFFSKYEAFYATSVNGPWRSFWSTTDKGQTSTYIGGLSPNSDYYFKIEDSASVVGTTSSNTLQVRTKSVPQLTITSNTMTTASLRWVVYNTYSSHVPFKSYIVQMRTSGGSWSTLTTITDASQNTYTVTGLSPGTYDFQMIDKVGSTGQHTSTSNIANLVIPEPTPTPLSIQDIISLPIGTYLAILIVSIIAIIIVIVLILRRRNTNNNYS